MNGKAILVREGRGGSAGWERIPYFFAAAGDIQAKPTRVSGGLDLLVMGRKRCPLIFTTPFPV